MRFVISNHQSSNHQANDCTKQHAKPCAPTNNAAKQSIELPATFWRKMCYALLNGAVLLTIVACEGDKLAANSATDVTANTAENATTTEPTTFTIALDWVPNTNHTGLYVARELGYFAENGLKVNIVQPSEDSGATLVANKRADLGVYFQPNMAKRLNKGEPITAIAAINQHNTAGLMSLKTVGSKTINMPKDLKGLRYASWEDTIDDATVADLVGEPLNKIPLEVTDVASGFKLNQFDYLIIYYGWDGVNTKLKDLQTAFFPLKDFNPAFDYYTPVLIANNNELAAHPETYKAALKAIKKGYQYAAAHPSEAAEILIKAAPETNPELVRASQEYLSKQYLGESGDWGRFDYARWDKFYAWASSKGLAEKLPPQTGVTNDYLPAN